MRKSSLNLFLRPILRNMEGDIVRSLSTYAMTEGNATRNFSYASNVANFRQRNVECDFSFTRIANNGIIFAQCQPV